MGSLSWPRLTASRGLWERCFPAQSIRVRECLRLRVKGINFGRNEVLAREGTSDKDCATRLPSAVVPRLSAHLEGVCTFHFLVCLLCRSTYLYRFCRLAVRRVVSSGMALHAQCAGGVFLCLGGLETRETNQR